ncbi:MULTISPECIES: TIGR02678 family protein [Actinomadura]|uniref:TIGR02678 family protein n=1 Tax=Actinomadura geliboluensis TaxID=882440 RepID=A0A5S4HA21_9ACTN|nr:TIGR02678 family protein [Actinomadura geliboluensis]TMR42108.1 TIGR02678 family protein [Actinomadura geliboluensis]
MSTLANQLAREEKEELARAIRLLLGRPLVSLHTDPEGFDLVRRRHAALTRWFDYYCGWRLFIEPRLGYARLVKVRGAADPSRPARRRRSTRAPFDRRRYTLLCLVAAEALAAPVTTIGMLAQRVVQAAGADEQIPSFDPVRGEERAAFVDALKLLEHYGAVTAVDGATDAFLDNAEAKVLYRVDTTRTMRLLSAPVAPSRLTGTGWPDLDELAVERRYGSDEPTETQKNLWARHSLLRRLLDDPVVYRTDLSPAEIAYAGSLTGRQILRRAAEEAGLEFEERAEGYLLVDTDALATDSKFPDDGSHAKVAALLLLDRLVRDGESSRAVLTGEVARLLERRPRWAMAYQSEGGAARLVDDALSVLYGFGLARPKGGLVRALPAAHRYSVTREEPS